ncbi:unnamed protein product [Caenorhabditis auriculariae]|uniref:NAD-dependent epimerase/dehydratase domain-containing protein n=1 Tax=Caenorhabditis auriculariae TaxID=2777116 RepID=A0A8S1HXK8_9PELO|nr:unnamed protein product [Caenorhabditis auriculariae]
MVSCGLIELWVMVKIYLLAAFLAIRELIFDHLCDKNSFSSEISQSECCKGPLRCVIVTGANGTIGSEVVKDLLGLGFRVHALVHGVHKNTLPVNPLLFLHEADFSDIHEVRRLTATLIKSVTRIDLVVCCAGVMLADRKIIDGIESHFMVNVMSQAFLLDRIENLFTPSTRIVFLSSATARCSYHQFGENMLSEYIGPYQAYAFSKLLLAVFVSESARERSWSIVSLHPGTVPGGLYRNANSVVRFVNRHFLPYLMRTPETSSRLVLHTALRHDFSNGCYYEDTKVVNVCQGISENDRKQIYQEVQRRIGIWRC